MVCYISQRDEGNEKRLTINKEGSEISLHCWFGGQETMCTPLLSKGDSPGLGKLRVDYDIIDAPFQAGNIQVQDGFSLKIVLIR